VVQAPSLNNLKQKEPPMSVTFDTTPSAVAGFAFTCGHENGVTEHRYGNYSDAAEFLQAELDEHGNTGHLAVCGDEDCQWRRMMVHPIEVDPSPYVNVTTTNAFHLLGLLGITVEDGEHPMGSMSAADFLGRVLVAQAVSPADAGVPPVTTTYESGTTVINCGRREGYSEDRLEQLHELAEFAVDRKRAIQWA
jgi:hypothetical protein